MGVVVAGLDYVGDSRMACRAKGFIDDYASSPNLARARNTAGRRVAAVAAFVALSANNAVSVVAVYFIRAVWIGRQTAQPQRNHRDRRRPQPLDAAGRRGRAE